MVTLTSISFAFAIITIVSTKSYLRANFTAGLQIHQQNSQHWDKAKTYGDPGLIPTRFGEHVRQEIAWAGEISKALSVFDSLEITHINVNVPQSNSPQGTNVLITGRLKPDFEASKRDILESKIRSIAVSIVPNTAPKNLEIILETMAKTPPPTMPQWMWPLICLGLGASAGTIVERLRQKSRPSKLSRGTLPSKSGHRHTDR